MEKRSLGYVASVALAFGSAWAVTPACSSGTNADDDSSSGGGVLTGGSGGLLLTGGRGGSGGVVVTGGSGGTMATGGSGGTMATGGSGGTLPTVGGSGGSSPLHPDQACQTAVAASPGPQSTWVGVPLYAGGYLVTVTAADATSVTLNIGCTQDGGLVTVAPDVALSVGGAEVSVPLPDDHKLVRLRAVSYVIDPPGSAPRVQLDVIVQNA